MLESPEPKDPQDAQVGRQMLVEPEAWAREAHAWSKKYAGAPDTDIDFSKYRKEEDKAVDPDVYGGYSPALVQKFCSFGFQVEAIVQVLKELRIPTQGGTYFEPSEQMVDAVCGKLLGE